MYMLQGRDALWMSFAREWCQWCYCGEWGHPRDNGKRWLWWVVPGVLVEETVGWENQPDGHMVQAHDTKGILIIAFITINSGLVPLIEGLCVQIFLDLKLLVVCVHIFCFSFSGGKLCSHLSSVWVCERIHPHTLQPAFTIDKTKTTPIFFLLSKISSHAKKWVLS